MKNLWKRVHKLQSHQMPLEKGLSLDQPKPLEKGPTKKKRLLEKSQQAFGKGPTSFTTKAFGKGPTSFTTKAFGKGLTSFTPKAFGKGHTRKAFGKGLMFHPNFVQQHQVHLWPGVTTNKEVKKIFKL